MRRLVGLFYEELWNAANVGIADEILHPDVSFRGSVGLGARGRQQVCDYVAMVTSALAGYRCSVVELIVEDDRAAAKMRFTGVHAGEFLGYAPTGRPVEWMGAAFFAADGDLLRDIWVLGDLVTLHAQLGAHS